MVLSKWCLCASPGQVYSSGAEHFQVGLPCQCLKRSVGVDRNGYTKGSNSKQIAEVFLVMFVLEGRLWFTHIWMGHDPDIRKIW